MKTRILFSATVASLALGLATFSTDAAESEAACYRTIHKDSELATRKGAPRDLSIICINTLETTAFWRCVEKYVDKGKPAEFGKVHCVKK